MADLFAFAAAEEAQGRRRQMLRTALRADHRRASGRSRRHRGDAQSGRPAVDRPRCQPAVGYRRACSAPAEAERIIRLVAAHVGARSTTRRRIVSAELPETGERFEGLHAARRRGALLCRSASRPSRSSPRRLCACRHHVTAARPQLLRTAVTRAQEHPRGRRHLDRQDHAGQCAAGRSRQARRSRRASSRIRANCNAQRRTCVALRTKDGVATLADLVRSSLRLRPDRIIDRRGARRRSPRHAEGLGHRPPRRRQHRACQFGARRAPPP